MLLSRLCMRWFWGSRRALTIGAVCGLALAGATGVARGQFTSLASVSGDVAVLGAPQMYGGTSSSYVFRFNPDGSGKWIQEAKLTACDESLLFGFVVSVSGDVVVIGTPAVDSHGSVYVFRFKPDGSGKWIQEAKLTASNATAFGREVSVSDDVVVIGAPVAPNDDVPGSAYVFRFDHDRSGWIQEAKQQ